MNINEIELGHLRAVVALAEELNFGRAAMRLTMSQPPLTRLIIAVEHAVGAKLFARTTRRVSLTAAGGVFVAEARAVLARMEEALEATAAAIDRERGSLRLAYTPLALQTVLPPLLALLRERDHDVRIDLVQWAGAVPPDMFTRGRIDLAFADAPMPGLESRRLHRETLSLIVPDRHPLASRSAVSLEDISRETLIVHPRPECPDYHDRLHAAYAAAGLTPNLREREPGQNCIALVLSGAGLLLSPMHPERFQVAGLHSITVETDAPLYAEVWAVWPKTPVSARVQALIEIIYSSNAGRAAL